MSILSKKQQHLGAINLKQLQKNRLFKSKLF
jgi:hypothetical protein